ncbi:Na+ dependent nucleoside transporter N-terminal domain-containing protein [Caloranaerobacter azorensis]|nr:Na+ dependent nucleoside transporter N-terminal domain-containing protein [Caloranaerobacter azorensis]
MPYLLSENKKTINWQLVAVGTSMQISFALLVLKLHPHH